MDMSDKILVLLSGENQISLDRLCLLLGREFDDIKEEIGLLRTNKWLHAWSTHDASTKKLERIYAISDAGQEELKRRIAKAQEKKP